MSKGKKDLESQLSSINSIISLLETKKALIYSKLVDAELASMTLLSFLNICYSLKLMMKNVDPENQDGMYILNVIQKYKLVAWDMYEMLYNDGALPESFKFLVGGHNYNLVSDLLSGGYSVDNIFCYRHHLSGKNGMNRYIIKCSNRKIINTVEEYLDKKHSLHFDPLFPDFITSFLENYGIYKPEDFNDKIIENCLSEAPNRIVFGAAKYFIIDSLTKLPENKQPRLYKLQVLRRQVFINEFMNGFKPVIYNRYDNVPEPDNWILLPNGEEMRSTQITDYSVIPVQFSPVKNKKFRDLLKRWFWTHPSSIVTKSKDLFKIIDFLNMFFSLENADYKTIDQIICANYKSYVLSKWNKTETRNSRIYSVLNFIKYLDEETDISVDKSCYLYLNNRGTLNKKGAKGVKEEELEMIAAYINDHKNDDHNHLCYYVMFHIALNTEFRVSQIVSLYSDCIKESLKKNEYVIQSKMKQSGYEEIDQPCSRIVKDIIDSYLNSTKELRKSLSPSLKRYLFVKQSHINGVLTTSRRADFSDYLGNVCSELNLPRYTAKNLRTTYITSAKEYAMKNGLSDLTLLHITNHANVDTVNNHYIQEKIVEALQATVGVIIGNVSIDGIISADSNRFKTGKEVMVANGCGYCQADNCMFHGPFLCQKCNYFFATIDNIPYYKQEIERLKQENNGTLSPHDAEDLINLIRLNTFILNKLLELKEERNGTLY